MEETLLEPQKPRFTPGKWSISRNPGLFKLAVLAFTALVVLGIYLYQSNHLNEDIQGVVFSSNETEFSATWTTASGKQIVVTASSPEGDRKFTTDWIRDKIFQMDDGRQFFPIYIAINLDELWTWRDAEYDILCSRKVEYGYREKTIETECHKEYDKDSRAKRVQNVTITSDGLSSSTVSWQLDGGERLIVSIASSDSDKKFTTRWIKAHIFGDHQGKGMFPAEIVADFSHFWSWRGVEFEVSCEKKSDTETYCESSYKDPQYKDSGDIQERVRGTSPAIDFSKYGYNFPELPKFNDFKEPDMPKINGMTISDYLDSIKSKNNI